MCAVNNRLQQVLQQWSDWSLATKPMLLEQFIDGENHDTFLLGVADQKLVLKLFRTPQPRAIQIQRWAAKQDLAPAIIHADANSTFLLMEFFDGTPINDPCALADGLVRLHAQPVTAIAATAGHFDLMNFYDLYLSNAGEMANELHAKLSPAFALFLSDRTPQCLCHNDLVRENCFVSANNSHFIDWEYAQINNPWFDLASVIYYFRMDDAQIAELLSRYNRDRTSLIEQDLLPAALCAMLWTDILWHLARNGPNGWPAQQKKLQDLRGFAGQLGIYF